MRRKIGFLEERGSSPKTHNLACPPALVSLSWSPRYLPRTVYPMGLSSGRNLLLTTCAITHGDATRQRSRRADGHSLALCIMYVSKYSVLTYHLLTP